MSVQFSLWQPMWGQRDLPLRDLLNTGSFVASGAVQPLRTPVHYIQMGMWCPHKKETHLDTLVFGSWKSHSYMTSWSSGPNGRVQRYQVIFWQTYYAPQLEGNLSSWSNITQTIKEGWVRDWEIVHWACRTSSNPWALNHLREQNTLRYFVKKLWSIWGK